MDDDLTDASSSKASLDLRSSCSSSLSLGSLASAPSRCRSPLLAFLKPALSLQYSGRLITGSVETFNSGPVTLKTFRRVGTVYPMRTSATSARIKGPLPLLHAGLTRAFSEGVISKDSPKPKSAAMTPDFSDNDKNEDDNDDSVSLRRPAGVDGSGAPKQCRVLFSYAPTHEDELELKLNDVIEFIAEVEDGWWRGQLGAKSGVFPSNFVEVISPTPANKSIVQNKNKKNESLKEKASRPTASVSSRISNLIQEAEAKNQPPASNGRPVSLKAKQASTSTENLKRRQSPVGSEVSLNETKPSTAQQVPNNAPKLPPKPVKEQCIVLFPYAAVNDDELSLAEGQIINVVAKEVEDKGWWKGEYEGKVGVFPDNFVKMLTAAPSAAGSAEELDKKTPSRPPSTSSVQSKAPKAAASQPAASKVKEAVAKGKESPTTPKKLSTASTASIPLANNSESSGDKTTSGEAKPSSAASAIKRLETLSSSQSVLPSAAPADKTSASSLSSTSVLRQSFGKSTSPAKPKPPAPSVVNKPVSTSALLHKPAAPPVPTAGAGSKFEKSLSTGSVLAPHATAVLDWDLDVIARDSDRLEHMTADRPKAPKRRPPSAGFGKDSKPGESRHASGSDLSNGHAAATPTRDSDESKHKDKNLNLTQGNRDANKNRLSFKAVRQHMKEALGNLTNGHGSSSSALQPPLPPETATAETNGPDATKDEAPVLAADDAVTRRALPPKPTAAPTAAPTGSTEQLIAPAKLEEPKKPDWLEELSRKQAHRKSGLFKDPERNKSEEDAPPAVESKPVVPAKPSQIREEGRKPSSLMWKRPASLDSPSAPKSTPSTTATSSASPPSPMAEPFSQMTNRNTVVTATEPSNIAAPSGIKTSSAELILNNPAEGAEKPRGQEALLLQKVSSLESTIRSLESGFEAKLAALAEELEKERSARQSLEDELYLLKRAISK